MTEPHQQPLPSEPEKQDLRITDPRPPDRSWARMQPVVLKPSKDRLDAEHQIVTIKNTSREQRHIVIDRFLVGHELQPGQEKRDVDMLVSEIEYFLRQRAPNRFDNFGNPYPPHPIVIVGFKAIETPVPSNPPRETLTMPSGKGGRAA